MLHPEQAVHVTLQYMCKPRMPEMKITSGAFAVGSADWLLVCSLASL